MTGFFVCLFVVVLCVCVCVFFLFFVLLFGRSVATVTSRCLHMVHSSVHPLYVTAIFVYSPSRQVHTSHTYSHLIRKTALFSSASDVFIFVADFFFLLLFFFWQVCGDAIIVVVLYCWHYPRKDHCELWVSYSHRHRTKKQDTF